MAEDMRVFGVLSANGNPTGDKRTIAAPALRWTLPLPLRRAREDFGGHNGAVVVGSITDIKQAPTGELMYSAVLHDTPDGIAAYDEMYARYSASGLKYGVSVDLDDVVMVEDADDPEMAVVESGRLRGATLCDIPAYSTAYAVLASQLPQSLAAAGAALDTSYAEMIFFRGLGESLVAAGAPRTDLSRKWFSDPQLDGPTAITVTEDGRVYGHLALFDSCHIGFGGQCITPPRSATNYAYFNTGVVKVDGIFEIPVGHITLGTGHADARLSAGPAAEHYDNTGAVVADVVAGEDAYGVWFSGAVRDGVTPEQIREMRAAGVSGDWRTIKGNLEMVALLSVPVPGFPVPRMRAMVASGEITSLVASACFDTEAAVEDETVVEDAVEVEPSVDPAEVSPEDVAAAMAPAEPEDAEAPEDDDPETGETPDEPGTEEPEIKLADVVALIADLKAEIAALKAPVAEESPAEEAEPIEAVPGIERSQEDILAALDALVNGPRASTASILAELDAKVG